VRTLIARAPTRIDFGGGWTDVPPYSHEQGGFVCSVAISRYATVELTDNRSGREAGGARTGEGGLAAAALARAGIGGVSLSLQSDFPIGAGLGGSSAAGVAAVGALAAWAGEPRDRAELAERSRRIEVEDLGVAGGRQDHYAAAFGGALALTFGDSTGVRRIPLTPAMADAVARQCIVIYSGESRISGDTVTAVLDAYRARERTVTSALARMRTLAEEMAAALERGALDELGSLVGEHWERQRSLHRGITTARIEAIIDRARAAGAYGAKALGASGGGCVLVVAPPEGVDAIRSQIGGLGTLLPYAVDTDGLRTTADSDDARATTDDRSSVSRESRLGERATSTERTAGA
jgi:D-glycero-alpha-D-manno-heptose-7-phosphate kinase